MALWIKKRAHGDHPCVLLRNLTDLRVSESITGILYLSSLSEKDRRCPIPSLIEAPNTKLIQPWLGSYIICSEFIAGGESNSTPGRHKTILCTFSPHKILQTPSIGSATGLSQIRVVIPEKVFAYSCFGRIRMFLPHIGIYQAVDAVCRRRGQGRHSSYNSIYCLQLKGFGPEAGLEYRAHQVPQY